MRINVEVFYFTCIVTLFVCLFKTSFYSLQIFIQLATLLSFLSLLCIVIFCSDLHSISGI